MWKRARSAAVHTVLLLSGHCSGKDAGAGDAGGVNVFAEGVQVEVVTIEEMASVSGGSALDCTKDETGELENAGDNALNDGGKTDVA